MHILFVLIVSFVLQIGIVSMLMLNTWSACCYHCESLLSRGAWQLTLNELKFVTDCCCIKNILNELINIIMCLQLFMSRNCGLHYVLLFT